MKITVAIDSLKGSLARWKPETPPKAALLNCRPVGGHIHSPFPILIFFRWHNRALCCTVYAEHSDENVR